MPVALGGPVGYTPPEGGWGWAVVVGAFISIGFSYAFSKSITVFFKEIEVIFDATSSQVSWISSIMLAVMYGGGEELLSLLKVLHWVGNKFINICQSCGENPIFTDQDAGLVLVSSHASVCTLSCKMQASMSSHETKKVGQADDCLSVSCSNSAYV
ncbi:UNVERIFIED_CONTAM: hypothetical protein FKN15_004828 [Acipenser sinensis]